MPYDLGTDGFEPLILPDRLNYLHRGAALGCAHWLDELNLCGLKERRWVKSQLRGRGAAGFREIIESYGNTRSRRLDLDRLRFELGASQRARAQFSRLGCRGFSYLAIHDVRLAGEPLRPDISLRIALMPSRELYYPPRVKRYLRRSSANHLRLGGYASIAFGLAAVRSATCYVLVLQSDITRRRSSCIRDHFRGWRKVLFLLICKAARAHADEVVLFRADDVARACDPRFPAGETQVGVWETVYDRTANDFSLNFGMLDRPADIQLYANRPPVPVRCGYHGNLRRVLCHGGVDG